MTYDNHPVPDAWRAYRVGQGILVRDGGVLLAANRWYSGQPPVWTLPGGRADDGEGITEALAREFKEETGLVVRVKQLAYVVEARSAVRKTLFLTCAFVLSEVEGTLSCEGDEAVEELRFVPFEEIREYLPSPSLGEPLAAYLGAPRDAPRYWFYPEYAPS
jgi:8-oxo-dGTP diphosphatase